MRTHHIKIVLIRCPQPMLVTDDGELYTPNRTKTPEPTLPQLEGILRDFSEKYGISVEVVQLDLRDPANGKLNVVHYGDIKVPYVDKELRKIYEGVSIDSIRGILEDADFIGFTNNFTMSRNVVAEHIKKVRSMFPEKEVWVGGRDIFPITPSGEEMKQVYVEAAGSKNVVVFKGHVFESLPAYLMWKLKGDGEPFGVEIYGPHGEVAKAPEKPLLPVSQLIGAPAPIIMPVSVYPNPESLARSTGSGEGQPNPPYGKFVHMTMSIGCPNSCGYCTTGYRERFLAYKNMKTIQKELELFKKLGITHIAIMDDNLLALGVERLTEIMSLVNSYGFKIEYGNGLQLSLLNKYWDKLRDPILSNCVSLYAPLEDLTQDGLYEKLDSTRSNLALMEKIVREAPPGLKYLTMGVICGVPGHTKQALETTFMKNIERFLDVFAGSPLEVAMTVFNYMPLAGTLFGEKALNSGRMIADVIRKDPEVCSFGTPSYVPNGMTAKELFKIYEDALNLNPAGEEIEVKYTELQRKGEKVFPEDERWKIPPQLRTPGVHLRAKVPPKSGKMQKLMVAQ